MAEISLIDVVSIFNKNDLEREEFAMNYFTRTIIGGGIAAMLAGGAFATAALAGGHKKPGDYPKKNRAEHPNYVLLRTGTVPLSPFRVLVCLSAGRSNKTHISYIHFAPPGDCSSRIII